MKELIMPYGENGITFTLFNELGSEQRLRRFLLNIEWKNKNIYKKLMKEKIEQVYLFPSFGKRHGPGEPDAILITEGYNIFFELETEPIDKKLNHISEQIERFAMIGNGLYKSNIKIVRKIKGFVWQEYSKKTGKLKSTKGKFRNRKMFKDLLNKKRQPLYVVITNDKMSAGEKLFKCLKNIANVMGFINYKKIKKMKGLSKTGKVINFNIKK